MIRLRRACLWPMLLSVWLAGSATAATVQNLYEAVQPVQSSRDAAFVDALRNVVVRVSGQRDAAARLGAALNNPRQYVQRFGFTADGTLEVGFDSVSIDRLLAEHGLPIWGRERPTVLVMLSIEQCDGSTRLVTGDLPSAESEAIARAARERGLPIKWPTLDAQSAVGDTSSAMQTASRFGANATLIGQGRSGAIRWTLASADGLEEATGGVDDGIHLAADRFAQVFAASGSSLGSVMVDVSGIYDLTAYATTLNYFESMTLVRSVVVERVSGDTMQFRLAVRGDARTLGRAIALDDRLVPLSLAGGEPAGERLSFRYQP